MTEKDHVYAANSSIHRNNANPRPKKTARRMQNRSSHNELEKNRRAHLRGCLDRLKSIVPLNRDSTRHTTLGLLNQASELIKSLERRSVYYKGEKQRLQKKNEILRKKLYQLEAMRYRRDSTGSSWSSGRSESSNDSDKDDEMVIDVPPETAVDGTLVESIRPRLESATNLNIVNNRPSNLITINVRKPLSIPVRNQSTNLMKKPPNGTCS